jgi:hypothetical protein
MSASVLQGPSKCTAGAKQVYCRGQASVLQVPSKCTAGAKQVYCRCQASVLQGPSKCTAGAKQVYCRGQASVLQGPSKCTAGAKQVYCRGQALCQFCVGCVLTGYHCSTTVQNHLSVASKYCYTLSDAFRTLRPSSGCLCE